MVIILIFIFTILQLDVYACNCLGEITHLRKDLMNIKNESNNRLCVLQ